jgi:FkbM family methyltransferase
MKSKLITQIKQEIRTRQPNNPILNGWGSYSQFDEDGIIQSCLQKIAAQTPMSNTAVEIGCGDGKENNTHQLLLNGYSAVWIDGATSNIDYIRQELGNTVFSSLWVLEEMVSEKNAQSIATDAKNFLETGQIDFFSLDIDGNDIHVCKSFIESLNPKLVCVEYNSKFPPPIDLAIEYNQLHKWSNDDFFGASLQAWINFFENLEYTLVCCNLTGVNAFFVQNIYLDGFTLYKTADLYQPARYHLINYPKGHPASLSWLRQRLQSEFCKISLEQHSIAIANTKYGHMAVYKKDMVIGRSLLDVGAFQEEKISEVLKFLSAKYNLMPEIFVDIGANIGTHSIFALKQCNFKKVYAFEPDINNAKLFIKNISINRLSSRCEFNSIALSDRPCTLELELSNFNFGDHRIRPIGTASVSFGEELERSVREIPATSLDAIDEEINLSWSSALMWMDTQGHEGSIFNGGKAFFKSSRSPKAIVCEFWPYGIERSGSRISYFSFLESCFAIYDINSSEWLGGKLINVSKLRDMYEVMLKSTEKEHHPHTDLLLIPKILD